jgi:hypothetical protein
MFARISESPIAPPIDAGDYFISMAIEDLLLLKRELANAK